MQKIPRKPRLRGVPRIAFAAALTALTLWTVGVAATAHSLSDAAERLRQETALPLALLRYEMGGEEADELSLGASLALSLTPILADARSEVTQAQSGAAEGQVGRARRSRLIHQRSRPSSGCRAPGTSPLFLIPQERAGRRKGTAACARKRAGGRRTICAGRRAWKRSRRPRGSAGRRGCAKC